MLSVLYSNVLYSQLELDDEPFGYNLISVFQNFSPASIELFSAEKLLKILFWICIYPKRLLLWMILRTFLLIFRCPVFKILILASTGNENPSSIKYKVCQCDEIILYMLWMVLEIYLNRVWFKCENTKHTLEDESFVDVI